MTARDQAIEAVARYLEQDRGEPDSADNHALTIVREIHYDAGIPRWRKHQYEAAEIVDTLLRLNWREPAMASPLKFEKL